MGPVRIAEVHDGSVLRCAAASAPPQQSVALHSNRRRRPRSGWVAAFALVLLALAPAPASSMDSYSGSILLPGVRTTLDKMLATPFEFFDLTLPAVRARLLDVRSATAISSSAT